MSSGSGSGRATPTPQSTPRTNDDPNGNRPTTPVLGDRRNTAITSKAPQLSGLGLKGLRGPFMKTSAKGGVGALGGTGTSKGSTSKSFFFQKDETRNTLLRGRDILLDVGGSDRETVTDRRVLNTTSPLFFGNDNDLEKNLQLALDQSIKLGGSSSSSTDQSAEKDGFQFMECCGHPPQWKEFLDDNVLTDCTIQSNDGKTFQAHRCILAASCPFFYEKYCSKPQPEGSSNRSILLRTVDSKTLQSILDFVYTGEFELSVDIVSKLLPVANKFKLIPVIQKCCAYIVQNMTPENALHLYSLAHPYFCPKLESKAKSYILHNFRQVLRTSDFLSLEPHDLKSILKDDRLNARNEAMVFEAIRIWVEAHPSTRKKIIPELLSCVRFGLMSYGYFTNVVYQWRFVNEDEAVRRALDAPSVLLTSIDSLNNTEVDLSDPLARPRIPYEVIFAVGGWSAGSPTAFIETYDIRADRWFLLNNSDSTPRAYHGLVAVGQHVYMIGGFDGQEHFSTVKRYDPVTQVWEERSCMLSPRCYVSCCQLNGIIYACGGYNGRSRMASGEKYDPESNQWEVISSMNRPRSDASAASLRGKVYIAGGFTGTEVLNSVEVYDPVEDQWTFIQTMNAARSGISLVAYRDCLYALGGFNGFNRLNTAEKYDPQELGAWRYIPDMSSSRSNFAAVCADELLICIGGFNGATTIPYVECYDSKVNEWFDASHMNLNRSALSACVVNNLPNCGEYSYLHRIQEIMGN